MITATITGAHNDNSCSSNPEESPNESIGRTQYLSATCIVVTNYSGDVATVVDDHFTRALSFNDKNSKGKYKMLFSLKILLLVLLVKKNEKKNLIH